jgi:hypothetical protein
MELLFPKHNYNVLSPSSYTRISVRDLYISRIGLPILLQGKMWTGIYKSLTDTRMWKFGLTSQSKGIFKWDFFFAVYAKYLWARHCNSLARLTVARFFVGGKRIYAGNTWNFGSSICMRICYRFFHLSSLKGVFCAPTYGYSRFYLRR